MSEENFDQQWLETPFKPRLIRVNQYKGFRPRYVEAHHYVERLNKAFGYRWNLEILSEDIRRKITKAGMDEKQPFFLVKVRLSVPHLGIVKEQYGGSSLVGDDPEDAMKAAVTDGMKKCCWLLGIGLHISGEHETENPPESRLEDMPIQAQWAKMYTLAGYPTGDGKTKETQVNFLKYIGTLTMKYFGVPWKEISRQQADELIRRLEKGKGNVPADSF